MLYEERKREGREIEERERGTKRGREGEGEIKNHWTKYYVFIRRDEESGKGFLTDVNLNGEVRKTNYNFITEITIIISLLRLQLMFLILLVRNS